MKKHILAAAVATAIAAPAFAQNVQLYGILSTGYSDIETKTATASRKVTTTGAEGGQSGSRVGLRGTEDLGGGLKAGFVFEMSVDNDAGIASTSADSMRLGYLELSGSAGTIRAGRVDGVARTVQNNYTAHGNSGFAPGNVAGSYAYAFGSSGLSTALSGTGLSADLAWGQGGNGSNGRLSNSIGYLSPTVEGFRFQVAYGKVDSDLASDAGSALSQDATNFAVSYNKGPLSILAGQDQNKTAVEVALTSTKTTTNTLGASYDLGVAKAFLAYTDRERSTQAANSKVDVKDTSIGVSIPMGAIVLVGSYSDGEAKYQTSKVDVKAYQLQFNYNLSKRTKAYVMMGETEFKTATDKLTVDGAIVGVQHSF